MPATNMMKFAPHRLVVSAAILTVLFLLPTSQSALAEFRLATFSADVTPPIGHPLLAGVTSPPPVVRVDDPLYAHGFVLLGGEKPIVFVAIDWCEIRNDAYDRWRDVLAEAAGTDRPRVLVHCVHQHDAPIGDLTAEQILRDHGAKASICDPKYHEECVQRTAEALRDSLKKSRPLTHVGLGEAAVKDVASNRRYVDSKGNVHFDRSSMSGGREDQRTAEDGVIDPMLKAITFYDEDEPICVLGSYAVHPMSYWGNGWVTSDFPGLARERMQTDMPDTLQIYATGASGNTTAGKYNDGSHDNRPVLIRKVYEAMKASQDKPERQPLRQVEFRCEPLRFAPREGERAVAALTAQLDHADPKKQGMAALGLSWRKTLDNGGAVDLPAIDLGVAQILLLPGETYVEYQLYAQKVRPDSFVMAIGFGQCAPGFIPLERHWEEGDDNLDSWCWIAPGAEPMMKEAIRAVLKAESR
ncbi:MAG: hypothetical protein WEB58_16075 [Planctomycetaceae bacterium]